MAYHNKKRYQDEENPFIEKLIKINRVNKVVKGGKRLNFRSFVIVGDKKGQVGIGLGKSKEVPISIRKGVENAKKNFSNIKITNGTIPHEVLGKFGSSSVILKPAKPGTGVIAGGSIKILLEAAGIKDIVAKNLGSGSTLNSARAALNGLSKLKDYNVECEVRGYKLPVHQNN